MLRKYKEKQYETRGYRTEADTYAGNVTLSSSLCVTYRGNQRSTLEFSLLPGTSILAGFK